MAEEDLIFGKNQHFFGGMEPSTMIAFSAVVEDGMIKINAQLPNDTVVNGYSLCTVAGAVIRRKSDDYPVNEFDGDLVADITTSGTFADSTADPTAIYFYAAFPYTTQGVYSINTSNRCTANGPEPMVVFSVASEPSKVIITAELPANAAGAVIRKSTSGYPLNETDGDEFMTITSSGIYIDTDVIGGITYYYAAFPYTAGGVYSRDPADRSSVTVITYQYLFGYDLDTTDSDPSTRVTYPSDVDNYNYTSAYMNFSTGTFNYGSWPSTPGEKFMPKPCMLKYDGTVDYYLDPNNYTLRENSSTASDVANTSYEGNAMMEWPKIYTKRWEDENGIYHFRCCDIKLDDGYECWCNYDINNNEIDHFYTAIYNGTKVGTVLRSLSGLSSLTNTSFSNFTSYAAGNGSNWTLETLSDRLLINDLLIMISKRTIYQTVYGYGNAGSSVKIKNGTMNTSGLFWGNNVVNDKTGVKVFGMENWWGHVERLTVGYNMSYAKQYVKITRGTHDGSTLTDYSTKTVTGYLEVGNISGSGYIKTMYTHPYGRLPKSLKGSKTTYECCRVVYTASNNSDYTVMTFGGSCNDASSYAGPYTIYSNSLSTASNYIGACISCKPSVT